MIHQSNRAKALRVALALGLGSGTGCLPKNKSVQERRSVELEPCRLGKLRGTQGCTYVKRPRDPKDPSAGEIPIAVTVVESWGKKNSQEPPLFLLAGGPGQGARKTYGKMRELVKVWSKTRDVVLVDIRGTGDSDAVECKLTAEEDYTRSLEQQTAQSVQDLKACRKRMEHRQPHHYFTPVLADDLDAVRAALGYETISVYGGSYGTRLAMEYARRHDAHVHALVLDGVAPAELALPWHYAETFEASWNKIADYCEQDETCKRRFPEFRSSLRRLKEQVAQNPDQVFNLTIPSRDRKAPITLDPRNVPQLYFPASYSPMTWTLLPLAIDKALKGEWEATFGLLDQGDMFQLEPVVLFSIACNEDKRRWRPQERDAMNKTVLGDVQLSLYESVCPIFESEHPLPKSYFDPIVSNKPTLFLSGEADPVTPPAWADKAREGFENSIALTVPFTGHITVNTRCLQNIVNAFLDAKDPLSIDTSCVKDTARPMFFTSVNGPSENFEAAQTLSDAPNPSQAKVNP